MPSERIQRRINRLLDQAEEAADRRDWPEAAQLAASGFTVTATSVLVNRPPLPES